jgi:hypothetical protein
MYLEKSPVTILGVGSVLLLQMNLKQSKIKQLTGPEAEKTLREQPK